MNTPDSNNSTKSVVPLGLSIALFVSSFVFSVAGYGFRLLAGDKLSDVLAHAAKVVPVFVIVIPALIWLGSLALNKMGKANIHPRNAWTLGWLLATVGALYIMGVYS